MSIRFIALDDKGGFNGLDRSSALEENPEFFNDKLWEIGNICDGGIDDFTIFPFGLANQVG